MKYSAITCALFAVLPAVLGMPLDARDVDGPGFADGAASCQTSSTSPFTADAQNAVKYLRSLPKDQECVTNESSSGERYASYAIRGNAGLAGLVIDEKCSAIKVNCHKLAGYFETLISHCSDKAGHVQGYQYLPPTEWQLTKPGSCQKSNQDFYIEIYKYNP